MANAKKCDRCGNYYQDGYTNIKFSLSKQYFMSSEHIDLCKDCCEQFDKWMSGEGIVINA